MPPPITPQSLHVWFISTAQNLEHRTLFWFSASNVASYILYYSTGWHWMHGTKTKSGAPNSWLCSFPKNWGLFLITPQQRDTDNITLVYGCMVLGYMVFLAIFRLFGNMENVFFMKFWINGHFGYMVNFTRTKPWTIYHPVNSVCRPPSYMIRPRM